MHQFLLRGQCFCCCRTFFLFQQSNMLWPYVTNQPTNQLTNYTIIEVLRSYTFSRYSRNSPNFWTWIYIYIYYRFYNGLPPANIFSRKNPAYNPPLYLFEKYFNMNFYLCLGLQSGFLSSHFSTKPLCELLSVARNMPRLFHSIQFLCSKKYLIKSRPKIREVHHTATPSNLPLLCPRKVYIFS